MKSELAIVLFFGLPIIAVIAAAWLAALKNRYKYQLNSEIVSSGIDKETAKMLLSEHKSKSPLSFGTLRISLLLIFLGLGAIISSLIGNGDLYFVMGTVIGAGIGLLLSFIIEWQFAKKQAKSSTEATADCAAE